MKLAVVLLAVAFPAAYSFYLAPNLQHPAGGNLPVRFNTRNAPAPIFKSLGDFFQRLHAASINRRCVLNTFEESCINGGEYGASSDDDWLNGDNNPGKRCVNTFDESCINGGENGAGSDDDFLNGNNSPGRR